MQSLKNYIMHETNAHMMHELMHKSSILSQI